MAWPDIRGERNMQKSRPATYYKDIRKVYSYKKEIQGGSKSGAGPGR